MSKFTDYILIFIAVSVIAFLVLLTITGPSLKLLTDAAEVTTSDQSAELIVPTMNYSGMVFPMRVTVHPTQDSLHLAYEAYYEVKIDRSLPGFIAGWFAIVEGVCEVHVLPLKFVKGDPYMHTWGHELAHCIYGKYHKG